jgi:hypothetical protein
MSRVLSNRFPTVARLLGIAAQEQADDQTDKAPKPEGEEDGEGEGGEDKPADRNSDGPASDGVDGGEGDGTGEGADEGGDEDLDDNGDPIVKPGADANVSARVLLAFDKDASALVNAERERCITVFTSEAGRRNIQGAAAVLRETEMSADKATNFLATTSGGGSSARVEARRRLAGSSVTRPETGAGRDTSEAGPRGGAAGQSAADRREERNQRTLAQGGVRVVPKRGEA